MANVEAKRNRSKPRSRYEIRYKIMPYGGWTIWSPTTLATVREYRDSEFAEIRELAEQEAQ